MSATHYDILNAIKTGIQGLSLSGLSNDNVLVHKIPTNATKDLPATKYPSVIIAPFGAETIDPNAGTNLRVDIVYPSLIGILVGDNSSQTSDFDRTLTWRRAIIGKFHQVKASFSAITGLCDCWVTPQAIVDPGAWLDKNVFASAVVSNVKCREAR